MPFPFDSLANLERVFLIVLILIVAADLLGISLRGLLNRRPIILSVRRLLTGLLVLAAAAVTLSLVNLAARGQIEAKDVRLLRHSISLIFLVWYWVRGGYFAIGVTMQSLTQAIGHALSRLGLRFQDDPRGIALPDHSARLEARLLTKTYASIRLEGKPDDLLLKDIVAMMNDYFHKRQ
jgi:hypothetical protein